MLIGATILILLMIGLFSLILGNNFFGNVIEVAVDNTAIVNGSTTTFVVDAQDVLFAIDTTDLEFAGIALLITIIIVASLTGIQVLGSGLNTQSARIIILLTAFMGIWTVLSVLAFSLIVSIGFFGTLIYIILTIAYAIGVVDKLS